MAAIDNFRTNLRTAMEVKEINQTKLAELLDTSCPYVNRVLNGHTTPSLDQCDKLSRAVGYPLVALLAAPKDFDAGVLTHHT